MNQNPKTNALLPIGGRRALLCRELEHDAEATFKQVNGGVGR